MDPVAQHLQDALAQIDRITADVVKLHGGEPFPGFTEHIQGFKEEIAQSLSQINQAGTQADEAIQEAMQPAVTDELPAHAARSISATAGATAAAAAATAGAAAPSATVTSGAPTPPTKIIPLQANIPDMTLDDFEAAFSPSAKQILDLIQNLTRGAD